MVLFYATYDPETGEIISRRASDIDYGTPIPEPYVTLTEEEGYLSMGGDYIVDTKTLKLVPAPPREPTKEEALQDIAAERFRKETGCVSFYGHTFATDRESRAALTAAAVLAMREPQRLFRWKTREGFITLDAETLLKVFDATASHVEACYEEEAEKTYMVNLVQY